MGTPASSHPWKEGHIFLVDLFEGHEVDPMHLMGYGAPMVESMNLKKLHWLYSMYLKGDVKKIGRDSDAAWRLCGNA